MIVALVLIAQVVAAVVLWRRLAPGVRRLPPAEPVEHGLDSSVTVLLPTLNEAERIGPCLRGLMAQSGILQEVLVVDSGSTDATREAVQRAAVADARIRLLADPPLPDGWIGKVWALQHGLAEAKGEWVLGVDADIVPRVGFVGGAVQAANRHRLDAVSFSPQFTGQTAAERLVQSAILVSLIYRTGAAGDLGAHGDRVLANGQCFLARREVLLRAGGYEAARRSFCDDVTLARHLARAGERVGFLEGSALFQVRAYSGLAEMWTEWGRSIALVDGGSRLRQWFDIAFLSLVQGLPLPLVLLAAAGALVPVGWTGAALLGLNGALMATRVLLLLPLRRSYARRGWSYWLSPLADPAAVVRVLLTTVRAPRSWRGRRYPPGRLAVRSTVSAAAEPRDGA